MQNRPQISRRKLLSRAGMGIGALALTDLLGRECKGAVHHAPKATAVISLFMHGGPSQV
ncbi:MAG: hypothetical protein ACI9UA_004100, partial [Pseudoalteromonas tetraodonis]